MRNKKKIAFGAAALAVVMVAAGTYAWFSTTDKTKTNVFGMDNFDVTITEAFDTPEVPLVPGADITIIPSGGHCGSKWNLSGNNRKGL